MYKSAQVNCQLSVNATSAMSPPRLQAVQVFDFPDDVVLKVEYPEVPTQLVEQLDPFDCLTSEGDLLEAVKYSSIVLGAPPEELLGDTHRFCSYLAIIWDGEDVQTMQAPLNVLKVVRCTASSCQLLSSHPPTQCCWLQRRIPFLVYDCCSFREARSGLRDTWQRGECNWRGHNLHVPSRPLLERFTRSPDPC
jgi:hypothetical protein